MFDLYDSLRAELVTHVFSGEEPKAQKEEISSPRSQSWQVMESELTSRALPRVLELL